MRLPVLIIALISAAFLFSGISFAQSGAVCGNHVCESGEATNCPACSYANPPCSLPCTLGTCPSDCSSATNTCTDSDGGLNYYVKGVTSGYYSGVYITNTDTCLSMPSIGASPVSAGLYLGELYCSGNNLVPVFYTCPNGCSNGACLYNSTPQCTSTIDCPQLNCYGANCPVYTCVNGQCVPSTRGCTSNSDCLQPSCTTYSVNGTVAYNCPVNTCVNGACVLNSTSGGGSGGGPGVADIKVLSPNGGETWEIGKNYQIRWASLAYGLYGSKAVDINLLQYIDAGSMPVVMTITGYLKNSESYGWTVPSSLAPGTYIIRISSSETGETIGDLSDSYFKIVQPSVACTDSDNGDIYVKGYVMYQNQRYDDYCSGTGLQLMEQKCVNGVESNQVFNCPNGCQDGACISNGPSLTITPLSGAINTSIHFQGAGFAQSGWYQVYMNDKSQMGISANTDGKVDFWFTIQSEMNPINGTNIFYVGDGTKNSNNVTFMLSNTIGCTDSDGGLNYYVKGTAKRVTGSDVTTGTDFCDSSIFANANLIEFYCDSASQIRSQPFNCPNGCRLGACIQTTEKTAVSCLGSTNSNDYGKGKSILVTYNDGTKETYFDDCGRTASSYGMQLRHYYCNNQSGDNWWGAVLTQCPSGQSCSDGACTNSTTMVCTTVYLPVCGADDKTYSNSCVASAAGMKVAYQGECVNNSFVKCASNSDCPQPDCAAGSSNCPHYTCVNSQCVASTTCRTLYYLDNTNRNCDAKQFCGVYMYYGLQTFETLEACQKVASGPVCGNGVCEKGEADYCPSCVYSNPPCKVMCTTGTCPQDCNNNSTLVNQFQLNLKKGWNLFSSPVYQSAQSKSFFSFDTDCNYRSWLWKLPRTTGAVEKTQYLTDPYGVYWIKAESDCSVTVSGNVMQASNFLDGFNLKKGLNVFGGAPEEIVFNNIQGTCSFAMGPKWFNPASGAWELAAKMEPGKGYVVRATGDCSLSSDETPPPLPTDETPPALP